MCHRVPAFALFDIYERLEYFAECGLLVLICMIILSAADLSDLSSSTSSAMQLMIGWRTSNGMQLNHGKTNFIQFFFLTDTLSSRSGLACVCPVEFKGEIIGVWLQFSLEWGHQIVCIIKKISRGYYSIYRLRELVMSDTMSVISRVRMATSKLS